MKNNKIRICFYFICLLLPLGCATTPDYIPVKAETKNQIHSTSVVVGITQEMIKVESILNKQKSDHNYSDKMSEASANSGGGFVGTLVASLIGSLIDSSNNVSFPAQSITPKSQLNGTGFAELFYSAIKQKLPSVEWLHVKDSDLKYSISRRKSTELVIGNTTNAVLVIQPKFYTSMSSTALNIDTDIILFRNPDHHISNSTNDNDEKEPKILYQNRIKYAYKIPFNAEKSSNDNKRQWLRKNWQTVSDKLVLGIKLISDAIATDLSSSDTTNTKNIELRNFTEETSDFGYGIINGRILNQQNNYEVIRQYNGNIWILMS